MKQSKCEPKVTSYNGQVTQWRIRVRLFLSPHFNQHKHRQHIHPLHTQDTSSSQMPSMLHLLLSATQILPMFVGLALCSSSTSPFFSLFSPLDSTAKTPAGTHKQLLSVVCCACVVTRVFMSIESLNSLEKAFLYFLLPLPLSRPKHLYTLVKCTHIETLFTFHFAHFTIQKFNSTLYVCQCVCVCINTQTRCKHLHVLHGTKQQIQNRTNFSLPVGQVEEKYS